MSITETPVTIQTRPITSLQRAINGLLSDFESGWPLTDAWMTESKFRPTVDVAEDDKQLVITAEVPGMQAADVEVSVNSTHVTLKGQKEQKTEEKKRNYYRMERSFGSFVRQIPFPCGVDNAKVAATFKDGVLTVTLPKSEQEQATSRRVPIKAS